MEKIVSVARWGNSGGVLVPRAWLGKQVRIELIDRTEEIKKEVLNILEDDLDDLIGIYLVGSYARNEQEEDSDIDVIAISSNIRKTICSGKYKIEIYSLDSIKKTIRTKPIMIVPSLIEAKPIMNKLLLEELLAVKIKSKNLFKEYFIECKRIIKINKKFIELDKLEGDVLKSLSVLYSTLLRLRGIYLINTILQDMKYFKREFITWLVKGTKLDRNLVESVYRVYKKIRDGKKSSEKIEIDIALKFVNFLEKEVNDFEKKKKT